MVFELDPDKPDVPPLARILSLFGVLSLIFWALVLVITLKYVAVVLNADNKGEGGALALTALAANAVKDRARLRHF